MAADFRRGAAALGRGGDRAYIGASRLANPAFPAAGRRRARRKRGDP
jgi:hypothetical protein